MLTFRSCLLAMLLGSLCWFEFGQDYSATEFGQIARDQTDPRPPRRILIIGNSRTSHNDMPGMLRHIADSAGASQKYEILLIAPDGSSFESLSQDWRVQREVVRPWDDVVFQGESRGQSSENQATNFMSHGLSLLQSVHPRSGQSELIVNWAYDRSLYTNDESRADHYQKIQKDHLELARRSNALPVNVGNLWEYLRQSQPEIALTEDGNHPTVAASYFVALCLYEALSGSDAARVSWAPERLSSITASNIRNVVSLHRNEI
ncbi:DUF4886 domain-containing protein [Novosphingobium sp.]|uniref:DUF4886 domain-containing protein n=1 Tax=Novosphingobium sp. TaxID=1874826 RepID=UPI0031DF6D0E